MPLLPSKGALAIAAVIDIALNGRGRPVAAGPLARRHRLPPRHLEPMLQVLEGNFQGADRVGTVHDMRFVFLDNDTKLLFATAYDDECDPYIDDFATKIPDALDLLLCNSEGYPGFRSPQTKRLDRQAPDLRGGLVRRKSESDSGGDPTPRARRPGAGRIP